MRRIAVVDAPSNLGLRPPTASSVPGCAKAPGALRDHSLLARLGARDAGCVTPPRYDPAGWQPGDGVAQAAEIAVFVRRLADRIGSILAAGDFPVVLGGDCSILLGAGLAMRRYQGEAGGRIGLIYVDGHSDFRHDGNASYVGAAAGEALALATGRGQANLASIEQRRPYFRDVDVALLGIRTHDEYRLDLQAAGIVSRAVPELRSDGAARSAQWARDQLRDCAGFWVHVDVDVLDPAVMPAVDAPDVGGIAYRELEILLSGLVSDPRCIGVQVTVFDPDYDPDGQYAAEVTDVLVAGLEPLLTSSALAAASSDPVISAPPFAAPVSAPPVSGPPLATPRTPSYPAAVPPPPAPSWDSAATSPEVAPAPASASEVTSAPAPASEVAPAPAPASEAAAAWDAVELSTGPSISDSVASSALPSPRSAFAAEAAGSTAPDISETPDIAELSDISDISEKSGEARDDVAEPGEPVASAVENGDPVSAASGWGDGDGVSAASGWGDGEAVSAASGWGDGDAVSAASGWGGAESGAEVGDIRDDFAQESGDADEDAASGDPGAPDEAETDNGNGVGRPRRNRVAALSLDSLPRDSMGPGGLRPAFLPAQAVRRRKGPLVQPESPLTDVVPAARTPVDEEEPAAD